MQITKPTKAEMMRELRDYIFITVGLISYALGWALFLIPYQITTGGTTGIGAIIYSMVILHHQCCLNDICH